MMQVMALKILREIVANIQDTDFFSMMGDEATDTKNVSELVICLRWVDENLDAHDKFIGLKNMDATDTKKPNYKTILPYKMDSSCGMSEKCN